MRSLLLALLVPLAAACAELECGEGTHEKDGVCVANVITACGEGTKYENGYCVAADAKTTDPDAIADAMGPDLP